MSIKKTTLKEEVKNLKNKTQSYSHITAQAEQVKADTKNAVETTVGNVAGEVNGGVESLTSKATEAKQKLQNTSVEGLVTDGVTSLKNGVDDAINSVSGSFGTSIQISWSDPDSFGNIHPDGTSLIPDTNSSLAGALSLITGLGVNSGFVQNIVSNASPAGLKDTLTGLEGKVGSFANVAAVNSLAETANAAASSLASSIQVPPTAGNISFNLDSLTNDVSTSVDQVSTTITKGLEVDRKTLSTTLDEVAGKTGVEKSVDNVQSNIDDLGDKTADYTKGVDETVSKSKSGLLQGLNENLSKDATNEIKKIAPGIEDSDLTDAIALAQEDQSSLDEAVKIVSKKSSKKPEEIRSILQRLNTTIAGSTIIDASSVVFSDPLEIGAETYDASGKKIYSYVSTVEELEADLRQATRDITEVVVHWTETYTNKDIGSSEINDHQVALGATEIGYHYVIRRDGSIQRGRNLNVEGQHAGDHDKNSIGIAFVGGLNCSSGTENPERFLSVSSLTRVQLNSFEKFCRAFYKVHPGGQIVGHNDVDENELDPGFDVIDYCLDMFGKASLFDDPANQKPFTPQEINSTRI